MTSMKRHDFKEAPLSVETSSNLAKWKEDAEDIMVANSVVGRNIAILSTEAQIQGASELIVKFSATVKRREEIENVPAGSRTAEDRKELKNMQAAKALNELLMALALHKVELEAKQHNDTACNGVEKFIMATVDQKHLARIQKGCDGEAKGPLGASRQRDQAREREQQHR